MQLPLKNLASKIGKGLLITSATIGFLNHSQAEENKSAVLNLGVEVTAYFDFYDQFSPQAHAFPGSTSGPVIVDGRIFDKHVNQMTLNMAEISFKKKSEKVLFKADIAAGEMVDQLSGGGSQASPNVAANEPTRNVTQATLSYTVNDQFSVTAGKFYTHMGLEVAKAKDNYQYSRSFTYNYGTPFWHQGVSGTYLIIPGKLSSTLYLLNAWEGRISQEQNKSSTFGANVNFTGIEGLTANYNYIGGSELAASSSRQLHEINLTYVINPIFTVAADYIAGSQKDALINSDAKWSGLSLYVKAVINDFYSISPRYELFDDSDSGFAVSGGLSGAGVKQKISSITLTNAFNLGDGLETRLELRSDTSDSELYFKDKNGAASNHQESYAAAVLYAF